MTTKGSLHVKILYRSVFVEDFVSPKMSQKLTVWGGLDRENCECQSSVPPRKSNYTETRHPELAKKSCKKRKKEATFEHNTSPLYRAGPAWPTFTIFGL